MKYDFDKVIDRRQTNSYKYDFAAEMGKPADALPLWVADMDFQVPPEVTARLEEIVRHAVYGYSEAKDDYFGAVKNWFTERFGFTPEPQWLVKTPGVVFSLAQAIRSMTAPGDAVVIQPPVYRPFSQLVEVNERRLVENELIFRDGRYFMDLDDLQKKIADSKAKMLILSSPHNPVGRVWTREELMALGQICLDHQCLVVADEIHCDFIRPGHVHHIFASLSTEFAQNCILCTAPSKTFNLAGLQASNIFIPNESLRRKFKNELNKVGYHSLNPLGLAACQAAYEYGQDWLEELKNYLEGNLALLKDSLKDFPKVKIVEPEGTYLVWLDFRAVGLTPKALDELLLNKAKVWFDEGQKFGQGGEGFQRINLACPRSTLAEAIKRLTSVL